MDVQAEASVVAVHVPNGQAGGPQTAQGGQGISWAVIKKGKGPVRKSKEGKGPSGPRVDVSHVHLTENLVNLNNMGFNGLNKHVSLSGGPSKTLDRPPKDISNKLDSQAMKMK